MAWEFAFDEKWFPDPQRWNGKEAEAEAWLNRVLAEHQAEVAARGASGVTGTGSATVTPAAGEPPLQQEPENGREVQVEDQAELAEEEADGTSTTTVLDAWGPGGIVVVVFLVCLFVIGGGVAIALLVCSNCKSKEVGSEGLGHESPEWRVGAEERDPLQVEYNSVARPEEGGRPWPGWRAEPNVHGVYVNV